jgi:RHS repeat-associated protein
LALSLVSTGTLAGLVDEARADTFGKTTVGATADNGMFANYKIVHKATLSVPGSVTKLSLYAIPGINSPSAQSLKAVVYADSEGSPGKLLATGSEVTYKGNVNGSGWFELPLASPLELNPGTYWIGFIDGNETEGMGYKYDESSNSRAYNTNTFSSGPTNPFGTATKDSEQASIYATYTPIPVFGKTSVGAISDNGMFANYKIVHKATLSAPGAVTKLTLYAIPGVKSPSAQSLKAVVYADSGGSPGGLLATGTEVSYKGNVNGSGWFELPFASAVQLTTGTYWIGFIDGSETEGMGYKYDEVSNSRAYNTNTFSSGPTNPFGTATKDSRQASIYATYTPAPTNTSVPTITGTAQQGQTLTEHHGSWTGEPTSYSYQWQQCNVLGEGCLPIAGATSQTYVPVLGDVGHTLTVQEKATNSSGTSEPASSAATAEVTSSACTDTWTGPAEAEWDIAADWSTGKVPTSSDTVCIPSGKTVDVKNAGTHDQAGVVKGEGTIFEQAGGYLEITNVSEPSLIATLHINGSGTLAGSATLKVSKALEWYAGSMEGSGTTVVLPGASGHAEDLLKDRTLINEGTLTVSGSELGLAGNAEIVNTHTGTFIANYQVATAIGTLEGTPRGFVNRGIFEKTEDTGGLGHTSRIAVPFENFGEIKQVKGFLEFTSPVSLEHSTQYGGSNPSAPGHLHPQCGKPVTCATGNEAVTQSDLTVGGRGVGLNLTRTYNSQAASESTKGPFGYGWSATFGDSLSLETAKATLHQANGSTVPFSESGGAFTAPVWSQDKLAGSKEAGYTLTYPNQTQYKFLGANGRLESITDRNGNRTELTYNEAGRLTTVTDPVSRKLTLTYNAEGLVEKAEDPTKHAVKYAYESGNLASVTLPGEASARWSFKYDASHQLTELTDGRAGKTVNEYNASHQLTKQTDPLKRELSFEYEPFHTKITNKTTGSVTDERFTSYDEPFSVTRGFGTTLATTESFAYNESGYITSVTDGNSHVTTYGYDSEGNRTSMLDPNKNETKWGYNSTHDVTLVTTPKGEKTTIKRDSHGNAEAIERPAPSEKTQITKYKYGAHGELESVEDPLKRVWKYEYDTNGDRSAEIDPESDKRTFKYDEDSFETSSVSPRGNVEGAEAAKYTTKVERDEQERTIKVTDPLGHTTKYKYDGNGNLESLTDANSHTTTYTYDADNEQSKVKQPNGITTETEYGGEGHVTAQIDGNKHKTTYARNILGQVKEVEDPLKHKTTTEYDLAGNLEKLIDPAKRTTTYKYDLANRLTEVTYSDGKTHSVKYEYDVDGDRTKMEDGTGTSKYTYDQLDRLTESEDGHKDLVKYEDDLANQQTKITYPSGKAVAREYDNAGRLKSVLDWAEHTTKFAYDPDSHLKAIVWPSGTSGEDKYTYNEADQLTKTEMNKGAESLASLTYARDPDGQLESTTQKGLPGEEKTSYSYDEGNRVTKGGTVEYKYDEADNPTKTGTSTNTYNEGNELTEGTGVKYSYDELGERTKRTPTTGPPTTFGYDQAGSLTSVERNKEGETSEINDGYGYDGSGLRASQTISGTTSYLAWDVSGSLPLLINDGTNSYIYGPGDHPIEQISTGGTMLYLHHDQQGSTRLLTGATGAKEASVTYDAYGNQTGHTGTVATPLDYDGQYTSSDTGLIYLRARVYDPSTAQFLTVDPAGPITRAPYTYAGNNPLNGRDNSGLDIELGFASIPTPTFEEVGNFAAGFTDTLTFGATKWVREELGINVDTCSTAYRAGGYSALAVAVLIPGEGEAELGAEAIDQGIAGVIRGYTQHGLEQAIERDAGRGVSPTAILDAVRSPVSKSIQADGATKYVGQNAVVVVSSDGRVITTYARNAAGLRGQP